MLCMPASASTTTIRELLPGSPGPIRIHLHAPGTAPPRPFLPGAFFVTSCGCHAGLAPARNPSTCALGSPGSWSPLRVRVGGSSKAFDMLMHAGPSLIRACRDKPTGCTLRATDRRNFPFPFPFSDATGTTKDPRTRVVAVAVIACSLRDGALKEEGRITQVLPFGCNVVQGEALALALLLKHTTGVAAVTADCKPAILQAQGAFFKTAHANIWDEVWEERHRLNITWHPSHRPAPEYQDRYGDSNHWRVRLNNLADQACKEAAAGISWRQHEAQVAQLDELAKKFPIS